MKNFLILAFSALAIFSCKELEDPNELKMPQQWTLIGYKSAWLANPPLEPISDTTYNYRLEADGSFIKNIGKYRLSGTWELEIGLEEQKWITLAYDKASIELDEDQGSWGLIHYCGQTFEPFTILDSDTVVGSWGECDGPYLYFKKR
ncbi:MAG: hypothetical protein ACI8X3_002524 [Saprospiraceae bacterium]|jgi:hypothetical protein